jgi:hypothetical protein
MALVRVYLTTCRRGPLLRRALASLRAQTFRDWVCELHNDAPEDPFPAELAREQGDPRIRVLTHARNLGALATFNLAFGPCAERYVSILEDDNWWEPEFLARMLAALEARPAVTVAWSNMRIWREQPDGTWQDSRQLVWPSAGTTAPELRAWPHVRQAWWALHSNGALLIRNGPRLGELQTPVPMRLDFVEAVRERAMPHPLLYVPEPLVNFAVTLATARSASRDGMPEHYVLLLASFFRHVQPHAGIVDAIWAAARAACVRSTDKLMLAGLYAPECRPLLRRARLGDWLAFLAAQIRHPRLCWHALHARERYPELAGYLDRHTAARCAAAGSRV